MPAKLHLVRLTPEARTQLEQFARSHRHSLRERLHARILLRADADQEGGGSSDERIAMELGSSSSTVARVRRIFAGGGLPRALHHGVQVRRKKTVLDGAAEAHLIALTCSAPPDGFRRWSLHLLKDTLIEQGYVASVSHETVRRVMKKKRTQAVVEEMLVHSA